MVHLCGAGEVLNVTNRKALAQQGELHAQRLTELWKRVRAQRRPGPLVRQLAQLKAVHRQFARSAQTLPRTLTANRFRRVWVESLQADTRAIEALRVKREAMCRRLQALASARLEGFQHLLRSAPTFERQGIDSLAPLIMRPVLLVVAAIFAVRGNYAFTAGCFAALSLLKQITTELEFDGRRLRTIHRLFGVICWPVAALDLVEFNRVALTDYEVTEAPNKPPRTVVTLVSTRGERPLRDWPAGAGVQRLGARLREWCAIAARERT